MVAKAVCPKHEVAHRRDEPCPYCEPAHEQAAEATVRIIRPVRVGLPVQPLAEPANAD